MLVDEVVRHQLVEAEDLLRGLAVPGSTAHSALLALELSRRAERSPVPSVVLAAIEAVASQSELSLRAGRHARAAAADTTAQESPHWLVTTAHEWQRYLRWLVTTHESLAADVAALPDDTRLVALDAWERAATGCDAARGVWGGMVLGTPAPEDVELLAPAAGEHQLDTLVVDGRIYVSVDDLAGSLRGRAQAFADASVAAGAEGDELGELVSDVVATELGARADELDLASIQHASTCETHDHGAHDRHSDGRHHVL